MDITLCKGEGCLVKTNCKRYTTAPDMYQSWFVTPPLVLSTDKRKMTCGMFWGENTLDELLKAMK